MIMLTNRESASLILCAGFILFVVSQKSVRPAFGSVLRTFFNLKIIIPFIAYWSFLILGVWLGQMAGVWERGQLKDAAIWFVGPGSVLFFRLTDASRDEQFFRRIVRSTVTFSAFYSFFINIRSFSLLIELVGQSAIVTLTIIVVFSGRDDQCAPAKKLGGALLSLIAAIAVLTTISYLYHDWHDLNYSELIRTFILPIWLSVWSLPCLFMVALVMEYETAFMRLSFAIQQKPLGWKRKSAVLCGLNVRLRAMHDLHGYWATQIASASTFRKTYSAVLAYRRDRSRKLEEEQAARDRLVQLAGVDGVDSEGLRLDRREFEETQTALRWLATCQMGWYTNRGKIYHRDLLEKLSDFSSHGLPGDNNIEMKVRKDGQAWYAWRRTITG